MKLQPEIFLICGPNGAGKSTFNKRAGTRENMIVVDTDQIALEKNISNFSAGKLVGKMLRKNLSEQKTFAYESTLTANFDFRLCEQAKQKGYKINFIYVGLDSKETSQNRVSVRVKNGGHDIPAEDIVRRYQKSLNNLRKIIPQVDSAKIYCNSFNDYKEVAQFSQGKITKLSDSSPDWFRGLYSDATKAYSKHRADLKNKNWHNDNPAHQDVLIGIRMRATGHSQTDIQMAIALESPVRSPEHAAECVKQAFSAKGDEILQSEKAKIFLEDWKKIETQNESPAPKEQPKQKSHRMKM